MEHEWNFLWFEPLEFEWDHEKDKSNRRKHGVGFEEATQIFNREVLARLETHATEERYVALGHAGEKILVAVFTERRGNIRIISARKAAPSERRWYGTHLRG
ncbi:MAG TPA: BrnT family toxin [Aestuariivirga sp.]|nr:BrnT family toxin [Aestuariivirga sp.]